MTSPPRSGPVRSEDVSAPIARAWYESAATQHDFGRVLAGADSERRHTYQVVNTSKRPIKVSRVVNMKPCCGNVAAVAPVVLEPGRGVEVTVTIKVGPAAGRLQHFAVLESDDPDHPQVGLTTLATCVPRAVVDEVASSHPALLAGESARVEFVIHSYGDGATPPLELDERVSGDADRPDRPARRGRRRTEGRPPLARRPFVPNPLGHHARRGPGRPGRRRRRLEGRPYDRSPGRTVGCRPSDRRDPRRHRPCPSAAGESRRLHRGGD